MTTQIHYGSGDNILGDVKVTSSKKIKECIVEIAEIRLRGSDKSRKLFSRVKYDGDEISQIEIDTEIKKFSSFLSNTYMLGIL